MLEWGWDRQKQDRTRQIRGVQCHYGLQDDKMGFFAVQASPLGTAVITNIFLCPDADCHRETPRAIGDSSRKVSLEPGEGTLYKFDVELLGRARTYSITVTRLTGKETDLRHLVVQGAGWRTRPFQICLIYIYIFICVYIYKINIYIYICFFFNLDSDVSTLKKFLNVLVLDISQTIASGT